MDDTDTLLALVSSLVTGNTPNTDVMLDTLVRCDGDVKAAAQLLNSQVKEGKKRKRVDLDDWLKTATSKSPKKKSSGKPEPSILNDSERTEMPSVELNIASSSSTPKKSALNLMSVLRQPPSPQKTVPRLPPLLLFNPAMVAQNTPCTLHLSVLPPELACKLFYTMFNASRDWKRHKWWLFDRVVESPHRSSFYVRKGGGVDDHEPEQEAAQFWYNGQMTDPPIDFPPAMEEACNIVERLVNEEMKKRKRFPLEWGGGPDASTVWRANMAASNCYEGSKEGVGFHSDHMTYLGPYPTIASLSLGTQRIFSLREVVPTDQASVRKARTFNIPLPHNSLTIMHASCQEGFKHSVPPQPAIDLYRPTFPESPGAPIEASNCRINITFRFYRPDFHPRSIPHCKCGIPMVLRADMKNRSDGKTDRYWWACFAGAQNEGKGCNYWKVMDIESEARGPCVGTTEKDKLP